LRFVSGSPARSIAASRAAALMPAASALLVMAVGFVLAARAVPGVV